MTTYPPGNFSFFLKSNDYFSEMWANACTDAYNVCEEENLWPFFKNFSPPDKGGYMWWGAADPHYSEWKHVDGILSKIDTGHSGASWSCLMRAMEKIAKRGWDVFVLDNLPILPSPTTKDIHEPPNPPASLPS